MKINFFADLLLDRVLAERHIDVFITHLNTQVRRNRPSVPGVLIADLRLSYALSVHYNTTAEKIKKCTILLQYAAVFKHNMAYRTLLFPAHVGGKEDSHLLVFSVNFAKHEYSFGE